jgi:hypothetical protein
MSRCESHKAGASPPQMAWFDAELALLAAYGVTRSVYCGQYSPTASARNC